MGIAANRAAPFQRGSEKVVEVTGVEAREQKVWVQPELKRLDAGAAETGTNVNEDNNPDPFNARS